jgi:hypothetical protein
MQIPTTHKEELARLAALAETSMSEGKVDSTDSTEARSEEVRSEISRRHSVARALNMDNEMRRELRTKVDENTCRIEGNDLRAKPRVVRQRLSAFKLDSFLELVSQFMDFPRFVSGIIC